MTQTTIGAQMFSLHEHTQTPADIAATLKRVRQMGYEAIQISGFGLIETDELVKILDGEGLTCAATHVRYPQLADVNWVLDYHQALKCRYTAIGAYNPGSEDKPNTLETWLAFADRFSELARTLAQNNIQLGYHTHGHDMGHFDGKPLLAWLIEKCDPAVWFEIDTYWVAFGGGDPAAWIDQVAASGHGRIPCVHFKDMQLTADHRQTNAAIGAGNLNWPRILQACRKAGVEWYLVEIDEGQIDRFQALQDSLANMQTMGLR